MSDKRDKLRGKTVGAAAQFSAVTVTVDGEPVVVRQPTVDERASLIDEVNVVDPKTKQMKMDSAKLAISAVILLTCVPDETGKASAEKVFEEADREALGKLPTGGWFDELAKAAVGQFNVDTSDAKNA